MGEATLSEDIECSLLRSHRRGCRGRRQNILAMMQSFLETPETQKKREGEEKDD